MLLTTDICLFLQTNYWVVRATRTRIRDIRCFLSGTFLFGFQKSWAWPRVGLLWAGALSPCRRSDKSVHSSIDTFSGVLFGSCHTGQTAWDICCHFFICFWNFRDYSTDWNWVILLTLFNNFPPFSPCGEFLISLASLTPSQDKQLLNMLIQFLSIF